jgi:hypothetical protein
VINNNKRRSRPFITIASYKAHHKSLIVHVAALHTIIVKWFFKNPVKIQNKQWQITLVFFFIFILFYFFTCHKSRARVGAREARLLVCPRVKAVLCVFSIAVAFVYPEILKGTTCFFEMLASVENWQRNDCTIRKMSQSVNYSY